MSTSLGQNDGCPIDANTRQWIDARASWLIHQFGRERVRDCPIILPTADFFPATYTVTEAGARGMLDQIAAYLDVDPNCVELALFSEGQRVEVVDSTALGLYEQGQDQHRIWLEASQLHEPLSLAATIAHELGHVLLLGQGRIGEDADDHEPLTDLLTVFLGLGVITANAAFRDFSWSTGTWQGWHVSRRGYLTMPMFGYSLALLSQFREEEHPSWTKHLRLDVRHAFQKSLRYFYQHGLPELRSVKTTTARPTLLREDPAADSVDPAATGDEQEEETGWECNFCGEPISELDDDGLCQACRASIRDNMLDRREERRAHIRAVRRNRKILKVVVVAVMAVVLIVVLVKWLG